MIAGMWRSLPGRVSRIVAERPEWIVAFLSAPLFFVGLGAGPLWTDEAQTAMLGLSVLEHGVPVTVTERGSVSAVCGLDAGFRGWHLTHPWMQAYLAAASLLLFGATAWAARLPFALCGWLCVPVAGAVVGAGGGGRGERALAALLTGTSVYFLLHARQARYYAVAALLVLLVLAAYLMLIERPGRGATAGLVASLGALVLTFDPAGLAIVAGIWGHALWRRRRGRDAAEVFRRCSLAAAVTILLAAVWLTLGLTSGHRAGAQLNPRAAQVPAYYAAQINAHVAPILLLAPLAYLAWRRRESDDVARRRMAVAVILVVLVALVALLSLAPLYFPRYLVPVVPALFVALALTVGMATPPGRPRLLAVVLVAVLALSGLTHTLSNGAARRLASAVNPDEQVRLHPAEPWLPHLVSFVEELRRPVRGPVTAVIEYLRREAEPGHRILTSYGVPPLLFHTDLTAYGGLTCSLPPEDVSPEWLWPRSSWIQGYAAEAGERIERELARGRYEAIRLPVPDRPWENREDIHAHVFREPGPDAPPVLLYRRVEPGPFPDGGQG